MENLIPMNMHEVAQKLQWDLDNHVDATEASVIQTAIVEGAQYLVTEALEGPYWQVKWQTADQSLVVIDAVGKTIGTIQPVHQSFDQDFRADPNVLLNAMRRQVTKIVQEN